MPDTEITAETVERTVKAKTGNIKVISEVVELTKAALLKDKEEGLTVDEQAKKYGLPVTQMRKALKIANITVKAKPKLKFRFTDGTVASNTDK